MEGLKRNLMVPVLYFVIPCYNEEAVLPLSAPVLREKLRTLTAAGRIAAESRVLFVDDGSSDHTWEIITALHAEDPAFAGVKLSHNAGEQNAYLAGMREAIRRADVVVTADCDLQDDIAAVDEMLTRFEAGYEIVYGVRRRREEDPLSQRCTSALFYRLMRGIGTELVPEHSQYRLMSRRAVSLLMDYGEVNLFLPALVPKLGLKHTVVAHDRHSRAAGKSNYNFIKLLRLAIEAVTSFSSVPLAITTGSAVFSFICFLVSLIFLILRSAAAEALRTDLLLLASFWFTAALLFVSLRVLGEYLYKTYMETKKRPRYHIETSTLDADAEGATR